MPFNSEVEDPRWQAEQNARIEAHAARIAAEKEQADAEDEAIRKQEMRERWLSRRTR